MKYSSQKSTWHVTAAALSSIGFLVKSLVVQHLELLHQRMAAFQELTNSHQPHLNWAGSAAWKLWIRSYNYNSPGKAKQGMFKRELF